MQKQKTNIGEIETEKSRGRKKKRNTIEIIN